MSDDRLPGGDTGRDDQAPPAPWSFKIMVVLAVLYLGWRLVQGIVWVAERVL